MGMRRILGNAAQNVRRICGNAAQNRVPRQHHAVRHQRPVGALSTCPTMLFLPRGRRQASNAKTCGVTRGAMRRTLSERKAHRIREPCVPTEHRSNTRVYAASASDAVAYLARFLVSESGNAADAGDLQRYAVGYGFGVLMANHGRHFGITPPQTKVCFGRIMEN